MFETESRFVRKCEYRSHFIWLTTAHFFAKTTHVVVRYNDGTIICCLCIL